MRALTALRRPRTPLAAAIALLLASGVVRASPGEAPSSGGAPSSVDANADGWVLPLAVAGNWKGQLGLPDCRAAEPLATPPDLTRLAGALTSLRDEARAAGALAPLTLHSGDTVFPSGVAERLMAGADGRVRLQGLLGAFDFDGVAVGGLDLSAPHGQAGDFFAAGAEAGLPWLASNLTCEQGSTPRCLAARQGAEPFRIVQRGPLRVALLGFVTPDHVKVVPRRNLQGVTLSAYADAIPPLVRRIRQDDLADLVVLVAHTGSYDDELALVPQVGGDIDLLVTRFRADGPWRSMPKAGGPLPSMVTPAGTLVLSGARHAGELVTARLAVTRRGDRFRVALVDGQQAPVAAQIPDPALLAALRQEAGAFCAAWGQPIEPGLRFEPALDASSFAAWVLEVLRDSTRAEVAVINTAAVRNTGILPIADGLSRADLFTLLPFGGELVTGRLDADGLAGVKAGLGGALAVAGLDGDGLVNGRELDASRRHRVVTFKFLADGGDGVIDPAKWARRRPVLGDDGEPVDLVDLLAASLQARRFARRKDGVVDGSVPLLDLHLRPLLRYGGAVNFSYQKSHVDGPVGDDGAPVYTASELSTVSSDDIYLDGSAFLHADTREHRIAFDLTLSYATSKVPAVDDRFFEITDWIRGRFTWEFEGLRALVRARGWMPLPFAEANLLSEFDRPESRDWHLLRLQAMTGLKLRPWQPLSIKVGPNVRAELLEPGARATAGLAVGYELTRFKVVDLAKRPLELESLTDWLYNDIRRTDIHEIRHKTAAYYSILDVVSLSATFSAYAFRDRPTGQWGYSLTALFGVNVALAGTAQTW